MQVRIEEQSTGSQQPEVDEQSTPKVSHHIPSSNIQTIIDTQKFSNLSQLLRVTAYVCRFIQKCKADRTRGNFYHLSTCRKAADKDCQAGVYSTEIQEMQRNQAKTLLIKQLRLILDETGSVHCGGRLNNAPVDDVTKYQCLLPKRSSRTKLKVRNVLKITWP